MAETELSWIQQAADAVIGHAHRSGVKPIVCASGVSPSGPIHLGNLREVMTAHVVAEEIRSRGHDVVHLHSWDDYDRFRKVPAGLDEGLAAEVGRPLAAVPDPYGELDSYAAHFIGEFTGALARLGVRMREVRQSGQYPRGAYNAAIRLAMDRRAAVFDVLAGFQTQGWQDRPVAERRAGYYPFKPYCQSCGRDFTTVTGHDGLVVAYRCRCGHAREMTLADGAPISGKLVWKVDWPMRWVHEGVDFEPAIPATALDVLEPVMLRWLYVRRAPSQTFTIDLSPRAVQRLYEEWDQFTSRASAPGAPRPPATCSTCACGPQRGRLTTAAGRCRSGCCPRPPTSPSPTRSRSSGSSASTPPTATLCPAAMPCSRNSSRA